VNCKPYAYIYVGTAALISGVSSYLSSTTHYDTPYPRLRWITLNFSGPSICANACLYKSPLPTDWLKVSATNLNPANADFLVKMD